MGSSSSKVAGKAVAAASRRQYPSTSSIINSAKSNPNVSSRPVASPSAVRPTPRHAPASESKSEHIDLDGRDPHFGSKLRALGPAMPVADARPRDAAFPTSSQPPVGQQGSGQNIFPKTGVSGTTNPAIVIVQARERIGRVWEEEREALGRGSFAGRTMLSAGEIADVLRMRDEGLAAGDIEKKMRLSNGFVAKLGARGMVANA